MGAGFTSKGCALAEVSQAARLEDIVELCLMFVRRVEKIKRGAVDVTLAMLVALLEERETDCTRLKAFWFMCVELAMRELVDTT